MSKGMSPRLAPTPVLPPVLVPPGVGALRPQGAVCQAEGPPVISKLSVQIFNNSVICSSRMKRFQEFSRIKWPDAKLLPASESPFTV